VSKPKSKGSGSVTKDSVLHVAVLAAIAETAPTAIVANASVLAVAEMTEEAILRGDRASTITLLMWKMLMEGHVELDYSLNASREKGVYEWCAVAPLPKIRPEQERSGLAGYSKSKVPVETRDPRACISCGDKASPLQPSGECDSCLSDRMNSEFSE